MGVCLVPDGLGGAAVLRVGRVLGDPGQRLRDAGEHIRTVGDGARLAERHDADQTETARHVGHQRAAAVAHADALAAGGLAAGADHVALDGGAPALFAVVLRPDGQVNLLQAGGLGLSGAQPSETAGGGRGTGVRLTGLGQADGRDGAAEGDLAVQLQQREVPAAPGGVRVLRVVDDLHHRVALLAGVGGADLVVTEEDLEAAGLAEVPLRAVCRR